MSEIFKVFDQTGTVTVHHLLAFVGLVFPGFVALRVYDTLRGGASRPAKDALIDIFIYSIASDAVVYGVSAVLSHVVPPTLRAAAVGRVTGCLFVIAPGALAVAFFMFQRAMMRLGAFPDSLTPPWNHAMNRVSARAVDFGAIVTFHDGRRIGARIGQSLRQTTGTDDLLLDEVWTLDENRATLTEPAPTSYGLLISRADCQSIEFVGLDAARSSSTGEIT